MEQGTAVSGTEEHTCSVVLDEKTLVIVNTDPTAGTGVDISEENVSQQVVQTLPVSSMDHAEVTIFANQQGMSGVGGSQQFVYSTDGAYTSTVEIQPVVQAHANQVAVTLAAESHPPTIHISSVGGDVAASSVSVAATTAAVSMAASTLAAKVDHGGMPSVAITNAQIVTARACPATVQWLIENFETAEGISLPRSTLYLFYLRHCASSKVDAVNAASFGKLIRSVFLGLRTRRLGTRGNSKYHYYGIRIKPTSPLAEMPFEEYNPQGQRNRFRTPTKDEGFLSHSFSAPTMIATPSSAGKTNPLRHEPHASVPIPQPTEQQQEQFQQFLALSLALPILPECSVDDEALPEGISRENILEFCTLYKEHCEELVNVIRTFQFHLLEPHWKQFWSQSDSSVNGAAASEMAMDTGDDVHRLPGPVLAALCLCEDVREFVKACDNLVYQCLVEILMPDVLRPIPSQLTQIVRNLSKNLENWLSSSMVDVPEAMAEVKMTCVSALSQTLRRYTSLNHLAQAARAVLQNSGQITQMLNDLMKVDFQSIQEQASWVCRCDEEKLLTVQNEFKTTLQTQQPLEDWAKWMEQLVDELLLPVAGSESYVKVARQLLLKWSFYSSMVIRDLTLRSAASFGSFHLIRLLYDEYMFYAVEHRVAKALNRVPISVLGEFVQLGRTYCAQQEQEDASFAGDDTMAELNAEGQAPSAAASSQEHVIVPLVASSQ